MLVNEFLSPFNVSLSRDPNSKAYLVWGASCFLFWAMLLCLLDFMKGNIFLENLEVILIALLIVIPVRYFLIQPFIVHGSSMEPSFYTNDYLIVDELSYRFRSPRRYEVIVFKAPNDLHQYYIKRIIGLPGETIDIKNGEIFVSDSNQQPIELEEKFLPPSLKTAGNIHIVLDANHYYVLGDNRVASYDSRNWGPLDKKLIVGRVWLRLWPVDRIEAYSF